MPKNGSLLSVDIQNIIESGKKHPYNILICYLLSKFLPNYFVLAESKLEEGFPNSHFVIDQYEIQTQRDRNKNGGGLIEYVRRGLICKSLEDAINLNSDIRLSEITIKSNKWAIFSAYRPPCNSNIKTCLGDLSNLLTKTSENMTMLLSWVILTLM